MKHKVAMIGELETLIQIHKLHDDSIDVKYYPNITCFKKHCGPVEGVLLAPFDDSVHETIEALNELKLPYALCPSLEIDDEGKKLNEMIQSFTKQLVFA